MNIYLNYYNMNRCVICLKDKDILTNIGGIVRGLCNDSYCESQFYCIHQFSNEIQFQTSSGKHVIEISSKKLYLFYESSQEIISNIHYVVNFKDVIEKINKIEIFK